MGRWLVFIVLLLDRMVFFGLEKNKKAHSLGGQNYSVLISCGINKLGSGKLGRRWEIISAFKLLVVILEHCS